MSKNIQTTQKIIIIIKINNSIKKWTRALKIKFSEEKVQMERKHFKIVQHSTLVFKDVKIKFISYSSQNDYKKVYKWHQMLSQLLKRDLYRLMLGLQKLIQLFEKSVWRFLKKT